MGVFMGSCVLFFVFFSPLYRPRAGIVRRTTINSSLYKALRSAGGIRHPLRLLRKQKYCEADKEKVHA